MLLWVYFLAIPPPLRVGGLQKGHKQGEGWMSAKRGCTWAARPGVKARDEHNNPSVMLPLRPRKLEIPESFIASYEIKNTSGPHKLRTHSGLLNLTRKDFQAPLVGTLSLGCPKQSFDVIFDTGSPSLFVTAGDCHSHSCHAVGAKRSSCFRASHSTVEVSYASGTVDADMGLDTLHVGPIEIKSQSFGKIEYENGPIFSKAFDGICGLSYPMDTTGGSKVVFENIVDQKLVEPPYISFFVESKRCSMPSRLVFGNYSEYVKTSSIRWIAVNRRYYWQLTLKDILIGGESLRAKLRDTKESLCPGRETCNLIVDTGTSVITAPTPRFKVLRYMIQMQSEPGDMCFLTECSTTKKIVKSCIPPKRYLDMVGPSLYDLRIAPVDINNREGPLYIAGMPFIEQFGTVFDYAGGRVGLAEKI
ncbi:hypothetical protein AAMO2058_000994900 [Amorphochlora amoebiformis]